MQMNATFNQALRSRYPLSSVPSDKETTATSDVLNSVQMDYDVVNTPRSRVVRHVLTHSFVLGMKLEP